VLALAGCALVFALPVGLPGGSGTPSRAAAQSGAVGEPMPHTDASVPANRVTMLGSSPAEANEETWGLGVEDGASVLVRYTPETGWSLGPKLLDSGGQPLEGFKLDQPEAARYNSPSPLAGQMTADGGGVLAGATGSGDSEQQMLLVRDPGGAFQQTAALPASGEVALQKGELLLGVNRAPMLAALDEADGHAGALVVPVNEEQNGEDRVLHWDGASWTSEPIEVPAPDKGAFQVLAIAAASPSDAWLLARLHGGSIALFRRQPGSGGEPPAWQPVTPKSGGTPGEPLAVPLSNGETAQFTVPNGEQAQLLTATSEGVWIDGQRSDVQASATMFFKAQGEAEGQVLTSWCSAPENAPAGTTSCLHELPEALPTGHMRSFAWTNPSEPEGPGERVITGFPEGVSLRLSGTEVKRVLALGGSARSGADVGGSYGSAFSNPREGWLGQELLPVHLTLETVTSLLGQWPASFRHALLALAPAPGQTVGALSSEALAVGDQGEVARFEPGKGWTPESLFGIGGRHETPRLRAVAWPTPSRAYAVGDSEGGAGQSEIPMWLWRGETGLWEPDPATPLNFRGNLLGIAFDPSEPARGYAVGQGGVLLSYGKTWTQEPICGAEASEPCLPAAVAHANFTSIAFAGSEAIVAYRKLIPSTERYEGGLLVNDGSGWQIDEAAAKAMGANVPWALAALPDGGAAFTASGAGEGGHIFERETAGAPWQETPTPYPGDSSPGTIAAFRENGALRVVAASSVPDTAKAENEASPPPGFPPTLIPPYPLASSQEKGVMRQTATGWRDEEHELNNAEEPPGEYENYDTVYQPDPVAAVMVNSSGEQGWAVGGIAESENPQMDTSDVWRYPADGVAPDGVGTAAIATEASNATFAIGGGAQCAAPCADLANAKIGPDVWLSHALETADGIGGMRAFLYTGPRVTTGKTAGPASIPVPHKLELERYAQVLNPGGSVPAYAVASPTDFDSAHSEATFKEVFGGAYYPLGGTAAPGIVKTSSESTCASTSGCYYAMESPGATPTGAARVIVLDDNDSLEEGSAQLKWLRQELLAAAEVSKPAIVIGNSAPQPLVTNVLVNTPRPGSNTKDPKYACASAYFYDSPEQNLQLPLEGQCKIKSYGSGTLGYVSYTAQALSDFIGESGFLVVQVNGASRQTSTNVAEVKVKLIPNIGELALEAVEGTLLHRSQAVTFAALARRPRAGNIAHNRSSTPGTDPYIPIPANCVGTLCPPNGPGLEPEYTFTSSNIKVGNFVEPNLAAEPRGREPLLQPDGEPIQYKPGTDHNSGLFCAFNKGETKVKIETGGVSAEMRVVVQAGSVRRPCGTVLAEPSPGKEQAVSAPAPAPAPSPTPAASPATAPLVPLPPAPVATPPASRPPPSPLQPFLGAQPLQDFVPGFVPPPLPTPARPTPPSGTSAVTSPVEAPEREEEQEAAPESVSNEAVAYRAPEHEPTPAYLLGVIVLAAFAGASARRRPGRRRGEIRVAPATISAIRSQRHMVPKRERPR
jgi:hypothetical protein